MGHDKMDLLNIINEVGWPLGIAIYVIFRLEKKINIVNCIMDKKYPELTNECKVSAKNKLPIQIKV